MMTESNQTVITVEATVAAYRNWIQQRFAGQMAPQAKPTTTACPALLCVSVRVCPYT